MWQATTPDLRRRPQVVLFVNEHTLLPVLLPLAPATTLLKRLPEVLAEVLKAHAAPPAFIDQVLTSLAGGSVCIPASVE